MSGGIRQIQQKPAKRHSKALKLGPGSKDCQELRCNKSEAAHVRPKPQSDAFRGGLARYDNLQEPSQQISVPRASLDDASKASFGPRQDPGSLDRATGSARAERVVAAPAIASTTFVEADAHLGSANKDQDPFSNKRTAVSSPKETLDHMSVSFGRARGQSPGQLPHTPHTGMDDQPFVRKVTLNPRPRTRPPVSVPSPPQQPELLDPPALHKTTPVPAVSLPISLEGSLEKKPLATGKHRSSRCFVAKGKPYNVTKKLGRGGSGRVYEVVSEQNKCRALKVIPLHNLDERSKKQIETEVSILQSLGRQRRVIYMYDWSIEETSKTKRSLYMIMELGQCDLDYLLKERFERTPRLDTAFVGYYWVEMLKCISAIHGLGIVHSDIKPANFVLAQGDLKIADFGIANALPEDTVNVYQEHLSGTPNYMAPETLKALIHGGTNTIETRAFRFGTPSDMWSLGCILYLMVYGQPPFGHIQGLPPKVLAITDPKYQIEFGAKGIGGVQVPQAYLRTMKSCLSHEVFRRPTASGLLENGQGLVMPGGGEGGGHGREEPHRTTPDSIEDMLGNALEAAGVQASPEELELWTGRVVANLDGTA